MYWSETKDTLVEGETSLTTKQIMEDRPDENPAITTYNTTEKKTSMVTGKLNATQQIAASSTPKPKKTSSSTPTSKTTSSSTHNPNKTSFSTPKPKKTSSIIKEKQSPTTQKPFACPAFDELTKQDLYADNLDVWKDKCNKFHTCTRELYMSENLLRVLMGKAIQLQNFCGLVIKNSDSKNNPLSNKCSEDQRAEIKDVIGSKLNDVIKESNPGSTWHNLQNCLNNNTNQPPPAIDNVCRLKSSSATLCQDSNIEVTTENFFNTELENLHCVCKYILDSNHNNGAVMFGSIGAGAFLFILVIIFVILGCRHRKLKRRLNNLKQGNRNLKCDVTPEAEYSALYSEIEDFSQVLVGVRSETNHGSCSGHRLPPSLPRRNEDMSMSRPDIAAITECRNDYLTPCLVQTSQLSAIAECRNDYLTPCLVQTSQLSAITECKNDYLTPCLVQTSQLSLNAGMIT